MTSPRRQLATTALAALCACGEVASSSSPPSRPPRPIAPSAVGAALDLGLAPLAIDDRGVPRLVRATDASPPGEPLADSGHDRRASGSARAHVTRLAAAWGVRVVPELEAAGEIAVVGGTIVRLRQRIAGLPVHRGELRVMVRDGGELVAIAGALVDAAGRTPDAASHDDAAAIALAIQHAYGVAFDAGTLTPLRRHADGRVLAGRSGSLDVQLALARRMWHPVDGSLVAAWVIDAYASSTSSTTGDAFRTVIAHGRVLAHDSLVADAEFTYRVFAETTGDLRPLDGPLADVSPHPTGTPDGSYPPNIAPVLVAVDSLNGPRDPWLLGSRTETLGNNVEAYADVHPPSGLTFGDFRATVTSTRTFDRTYDTAAAPLASQDQQMAAIVSLFYAINWLHDFWYDAGFTEAAGNAQDNNFGRGGEDRDALLAEAQDNALGGSRNNANMATPVDGLPPRMQVFLWSGRDERELALQPSGRTPPTGRANFGPSDFDVTAALVLADDGAGDNPHDACEPLTGAVAGRIVLADRGNCSFKSKTLRVQDAGGVGILIANNIVAAAPPTLGDDVTIATSPTIGALSIVQAEGDVLKVELAAGDVTARLRRRVDPELDGGNDATLVAHEFGHYFHHRLQDCRTPLCSAQSEGWGDFLALMLMARDGDDLSGAYPFAVYVTQSFTNDPAYFGIRRAPYSANPAINALSFRHMGDGEPLPTTHPLLVFGNNAQVHNSGEVWASALWEAYVALHEAGRQAGKTFDEVRAVMARYLVAGLLLSPIDATPTETRDAILAAAHAASPVDHAVLAAAFARRGLGSCAESPDRFSISFTGIVESAAVRGRVLAGGATLVEAESCDSDGVLDAGETGRIGLAIANHGHAAITDATVTLSSTTPGLTVTSGPIALARIDAYATVDVAFDIALDPGVVGPLAGELEVTIAAPGACADPVTARTVLRLDVDDVAASSATDGFDTTTSIWQPSSELWSHGREAALDGLWHGAAIGSVSDTHLLSPPLTASAGTPVTIAFTHRYAFEPSFDGGVVEYTLDGGQTWQDLATLAAIPYAASPLATGSALAGRRAFTGTNPAHPATETVALELGMQLAGATFQLRFRIATDPGLGSAGWELDDVAITGLVDTPFPAQLPDARRCDGSPPPDGGDGRPPYTPGGCCDAGPLGPDRLATALAILGILLKRRRVADRVRRRK
jgi:hypothetical protein